MIRAALLVLVIGCGDVDEPWQLDHDRIIAVRATPPRIVAGERSTLDGLLGHQGAPPAEAVPSSVAVVSPASLADALALDGGRWLVTAPPADRLAAVRAELALAADAPVPLVVEVAFTASAFPSGAAAAGFAATKIVWLGATAGNPVLDTAQIDGVDAAPAQQLVVARGVDVALSVPFAETDDANWLTSCGTMHDYDLPQATLRVEPDDAAEGELAVVVRTPLGGVAWRIWPIRAE